MADNEIAGEHLEELGEATGIPTEGFTVYSEEPKILSRDEAADCLTCIGPSCKIVNNEMCYPNPTYAFIAMQVINRNITDISIIPTFNHVVYLDLSKNRLTDDSLTVLAGMPQLLVLRVNMNLVESCAAVPSLPILELLSLQQNRIGNCEINDQPNLMYLDLSYNSIHWINSYLWTSSSLPYIKELALRGNGLTTTAGILFQNLVSLFLADNDITSLKGIDVLISLKYLHLRNNPLKNLDGFTKANRKLYYLNLRGCKVKEKKEIKKLQVLPKLQKLILSENPIAEIENYRATLLAFLPRLMRIDKNDVRQEEREAAVLLSKDMQEEGEDAVDVN